MVLSTTENGHFQPRAPKSGHEALFRIFIFKGDHSFCSRCLFLSVNNDEGEAEASPRPVDRALIECFSF